MKETRITLVENREEDAWFDLGLRQIRVGVVRYYRIWDFLTGQWLFKVCTDSEFGRAVVKAVKCPAGRLFSQLEGDMMVFQKSVIPGLLYDIISITRIDENGRVRREAAKNVEDVPPAIMKNFEVKPYEEATGKKIPGKYLVTLSREGDEKAMMNIFLSERAWPLSPVSFEERMKSINLLDLAKTKKTKTKTMNLLGLIKRLEKTSIKEVCQVAGERFGIGEEEIKGMLDSFEKEGRIKLVEEGYIKALG